MLVLLAVPGVALAGVGSISGRVTHGGSKPGPVPELLVCALKNEEEEEVEGRNCGETDSNGQYTIPNLPSGNYKIEFRPFNYWVFEYYDDTRFWSQAQWIEVTNEPVVGIDAELTKAGYIDGSITRASDGKPLSGVVVCAEEPLQEFTECTESGDTQGFYQLANLLEGNYVVEFLPAEGQGVRAEFYNGKSESSEADLVHVTPGVENIDAALVAEATITGRVTDATTRSGLGEIEVCAFELTGPEITGCELTEPSGSYAITDLPTGSYKVGFFSESVEEEEKSLGASPFPVQFWKDKPSLETADALTLGLGVTAGIDAELGSPPPTPANPLPKMSQPLSTLPPVIATAPQTPLTPRTRCRSGRRWKRVKGRMRCVKVHKRRAKHRKRLDDAAHWRTTGPRGATIRRPATRCALAMNKSDDS